MLATGGTLIAGARLLQRLEVALVGVGVLVELEALGARVRWPHPGIALHAAVRF